MNQPILSATIIYGLLVLIGVASGVGDILLYKWARSSQPIWLLAASSAWFGSLLLCGFLFKLEHFSFGAVVVLATMIHLGIGVLWGFFCAGTSLSRMEMLGLLLAIIAIVLLEVGRTQTPSAAK